MTGQNFNLLTLGISIANYTEAEQKPSDPHLVELLLNV